MIPAPTDGASSARKATTRLGQVRIGGVALAVAALSAFAGASTSSASTVTTPGAITVPGAVGSIPAAGTPSGTAGSITYAIAPGEVPNWILPVPTMAANSVYNIFNFEWQMWPPMYYTPKGSTLTVDSSLSVANAPVWSHSHKTMTITVKPWKWSDGQRVSSKDLLFTFDVIKAAVKASPANWASYVPGYFPDTISSMSTPNAATIVINLTRAVNPTWMEEDILGSVPILPSAAWSKDSANGPILNFTNPANAAKIYAFLSTQSGSLSAFRTRSAC
jgi:peptide/nickel transport system substrate-binding protein